jgi:ABC transport system ATP-binding/permease protein
MSNPPKAVLNAQEIVHSYGSQPVLHGISLTVHDGDRIGLIGRNGCGKSTLLKIMSGLIDPDGGSVICRQGVSVALLQQRCPLPDDWTVEQALADAVADRQAQVDDYHQKMEALASHPEGDPLHDELAASVHELQHILDLNHGWELELEQNRVRIALGLVEDTRQLSSLSGGELRRVDLAHKLLHRPDVLILDEPTNHIDTRSVEWIERFLEQYEGSCVLVTHDRFFLDRIVNRIVEIEFNKLYSFPGTYARFLEYKAQVEESEARTESSRLALIRRELAWYKRGAKARSTKQKARIDRLSDVQEQGPPSKHREFVFEIPEPERLGKTILEARDITYAIDDKVLIKNFSLTMQADMRVGIVGPNGAGKTTLLKVLMGMGRPKKGKVVIGENTQFLYVDQNHEDVDRSMSILDHVSDGARFWDVGKRRVFIPSYLGNFLFDANALDMPIGQLSGGEFNRLDMVKKLLHGGNFLILDEPTNDLDLYTLRVLEETIDAFAGCAMIVSHDRYFLNRVCTHMLVFEPEGELVQIVGNYDDYLLYRQRRASEEKLVAKEKAKAAVSPGGAKGSSGKLNYKEKKELEGMEATIAGAEADIARLETEIQDPGFYEQDHESVQGALGALTAAQERVETLFARWEELEARG